MRISVAMCTCNGERFLQEQLDSISDQERLPDELVIRDDGSSDGTADIIKRFAASARFRVRLDINEKNLGSTKNFENAIAACDGDIIVLADQDDVWSPGKLRRAEDLFSSSPRTGAVFSDAEVVDENLRSLGYRMWEAVGFTPRMQVRFQRGEGVEVLLKCNVATGSTMAFRAEHRKYLLPIPKGCVHDWWIALLVSFFSNLEMMPYPLIRYRQHSDNQIGAIKDGFSTKIRKSLGTDPSVYLSVADNHRLAYDRISGSANVLQRDKLQLVAEKANHYYARSGYPKKIWHRFPATVRELFSLRYHRYSLGMKSFTRDLLYY